MDKQEGLAEKTKEGGGRSPEADEFYAKMRADKDRYVEELVKLNHKALMMKFQAQTLKIELLSLHNAFKVETDFKVDEFEPET